MSGVVGVGIDLVDVERLAAAIRRRPGLLRRVFTDTERVGPSGAPRRDESLAARFAAKEATFKALGVGLFGARLRDVEVVADTAGRPSLALHGTAEALARRRGVVGLSLSLSHTAALATAVVVAEGTS